MSQSNFPPLDLVRFQTESFSYYSLSNLSGCVSQVMQNKNHPVQIPLDDKKVELSFSAKLPQKVVLKILYQVKAHYKCMYMMRER